MPCRSLCRSSPPAAQELGRFTARPLITYSDRGNHGRNAAGTLAKLGFKEIYTLRGGLRAWVDAGLPLEKGR